MPEYIIHVLITLIAIPMVMFFFMRLVNRADAYKKEEEAQWRNQVMNRFTLLEANLNSFCAQNRNEHDELYEGKNNLTNRVSVIEATQRHMGCDQPKRRYGDDA